MQSVATLIVHVVGAVTFIVSWGIGVAAVIFRVSEDKAIQQLRDRFFERGPVVCRRDIAAPSPLLVRQETILNHSRIRFLTPTRAIFVATGNWPVKGVIQWSGSRANIVARHPLWLVVFMRAWLTGWVSGSSVLTMYAIQEVSQDSGAPWVMPLTFAGGIAVYVFYRFRLSRQRAAATTIVDELVGYFQSPTAG